MNCFNELLKEVFLLYLKKWTETFWLFKSGEKPFAFIWLRWKNCWRLITYFTCKIIHVITPCVSSFSVSVKIINHKIHMNCFNELQILQDGLWWWWDHSVWVLEDGLWWWWDHSVWVLQVGLWSNFRDFRELLMAPSSVVRIGWDFYRSSLTIRGTTCEIFEQIGRRATALLAFEFRAVGAR